eukprot:349801-Chlamydomonas_euryale.AAC.12
MSLARPSEGLSNEHSMCECVGRAAVRAAVTPDWAEPIIWRARAQAKWRCIRGGPSNDVRATCAETCAGRRDSCLHLQCTGGCQYQPSHRRTFKN